MWLRAADFKTLTDGDFERLEECLLANNLKVIAFDEPARAVFNLGDLYGKIQKLMAEKKLVDKYDFRLSVEIASELTIQVYLYNKKTYASIANVKCGPNDERCLELLRVELENQGEKDIVVTKEEVQDAA